MSFVLYLIAKVVVDAVELARSWLARGVADRESELLRVLFHQLVAQRALANAARAADDDGALPRALELLFAERRGAEEE